MGLIDWPILGLSVTVMFVIAVRVYQLPVGRMPLWDLNRQLGVVIATVFTSTVYALSAYLDSYGAPYIGAIGFHVGLIWVCGSFEMVMHTLRHPEINERAIRRIGIRTLVFEAAVLLAWSTGLRGYKADALLSVKDNPLALTYALGMSAYLVWTIGCVVWTFAWCAREAWQRRPVKAASYALVSAGCACFFVIDVIYMLAFVVDLGFQPGTPGAPFYFALIVVGLALMAVGEPIAGELQARKELRVMMPLWRRLSMLCGDLGVLEPSRNWSAQVQLQRAFAEVADGLAFLAPTVPIEKSPAGVAYAIDTGRVMLATEGAASLDDMLPPRACRKEDQQVMQQVACALAALATCNVQAIGAFQRG